MKKDKIKKLKKQLKKLKKEEKARKKKKALKELVFWIKDDIEFKEGLRRYNSSNKWDIH